jgi:hypothetical protein
VHYSSIRDILDILNRNTVVDNPVVTIDVYVRDVDSLFDDCHVLSYWPDMILEASLHYVACTNEAELRWPPSDRFRLQVSDPLGTHAQVRR